MSTVPNLLILLADSPRKMSLLITMTGWIPLDNIVFIDLSDNKRTKELNWNFCLAIIENK